MSIQGTKLWEKLGHFSPFQNTTFYCYKQKKKFFLWENGRLYKYFYIALKWSEIQSRMHMAIFWLHLKIILRELYLILCEIRVCECVCQYVRGVCMCVCVRLPRTILISVFRILWYFNKLSPPTTSITWRHPERYETKALATEMQFAF